MRNGWVRDRHFGFPTALSITQALWLAVAMMLCLAPVGAASSRVIEAGPENYTDYIAQLGPTDTLRLAPGVYRKGLRLHGTTGLLGSPIVIEGPASGPPAVFIARNGRNTISLKNASFITLRNLVLDGRRRNADAVKAEGTSRYAHHITLENLTIRNYDDAQGYVGISTKCPAWAWTIRGVVIESAGTGMYLGDSDGSAPFVGGLIEHNVIRGTLGYNLQIKRQNERPALPGMPETPEQTIIRHNVFSKAGGGTQGRGARPNVLLGAWPRSGPGWLDRYLVYGNVFYQNPTEALLQATGRVSIYNNLFVNTEGVGRAVMLMKHKGRPPESVEVFHNTIVAADIGIAVWNAVADGRKWVAANAIFASTPTAGRMQRAWNTVGDMAAASDALGAPFATLEELDLSPRPGRLRAPEVPAGALVAYPDAGVDFVGRAWDRGRVGAYAGEAAKPPLAITARAGAATGDDSGPVTPARLTPPQ